MVRKKKGSENWFVYMVECSDKTIYTGITNDVEERVCKHNSGKGAKYTRSRAPVVLRAYWIYLNKSEAAKAEYLFKNLTRIQKLELIKTFKKSKKKIKVTMNLNHALANQIVQVIVSEFVKRNKTGIVAVADAHGELMAFLRMDGAKLPSINLVINKAWTAARSQKTTMEVGKASRDSEKGYDLAYYGDPKFTGFGGGVPVKHNGQVIGAVAVSGLSQEEDEELAIFGIEQVLK